MEGGAEAPHGRAARSGFWKGIATRLLSPILYRELLESRHTQNQGTQLDVHKNLQNASLGRQLYHMTWPMLFGVLSLMTCRNARGWLDAAHRATRTGAPYSEIDRKTDGPGRVGASCRAPSWLRPACPPKRE